MYFCDESCDLRANLNVSLSLDSGWIALLECHAVESHSESLNLRRHRALLLAVAATRGQKTCYRHKESARLDER